MTAASMESCRFAARRSPRGRFWSVVDVRKRLQRVRHPFHQSIHIKQGAQPANQLEPKSSMFWIQSSLESPKNRRMRSRRLLDLRAIPEGVRVPIGHVPLVERLVERTCVKKHTSYIPHILHISVTLDTFQLFSGWLKDLARLNI